MSRTKKLTLSALIAALSVLCLAGSALLPRVTLSLAALAGIFPAVTVIACGWGWAAGGSAAAALLALLLLPDKTAGVWFACFFGHYPIWKAAIERYQTEHENPLMGWFLKVLGFAVCMTLLYLAFNALFASAIPFDFTGSIFGPSLLVTVLLAAFIFYDIAFSILIGFFRVKILPRLR